MRSFPAVCYCCGRTPTGAGTQVERRPQFLCEDCIKLAEPIGARSLDAFEARAVIEAGRIAGQYLDSPAVQQTDLAQLTPEQYRVFTRTLLLAYGDALRRIITEAVEGKLI